MSKRTILHPDDFARLVTVVANPYLPDGTAELRQTNAAPVRVVNIGGGDTIERDLFGVANRGVGITVTMPDEPFQFFPLQRMIDQIRDDAFAAVCVPGAYLYGRPSSAASARVHLDYSIDRIQRYVDRDTKMLKELAARQKRIARRMARKLVSLKCRRRAQRRIDRSSRVRVAKRRAELARRKSR